MKRIVIALLVMATLITVIPSVAMAGTGNGAPSGAHFNLNIIGVQNAKLNDGSGGNRIFVPLYTTGTSKTGLPNACDILLQGGTQFYVLDNNATDADNSAAFEMPSDVATTYTVWVQGLGKPGGTSATELWAYDPSTNTWLAGAGTVTINAHNPQKFVDVSKTLFYLSDGTPVFGNSTYSYLWTYSNSGLKLAQFRFYPVTP